MAEIVEIELDGKRFAAEYSVDDGMLTVTGHRLSRTAKLGEKDERALAEELLKDMAESKDNEIGPEP
ncbi:hypothetical protein Q7C_317 [Methylophaga frappieri]|uniref:Uncharacterized protein n=1 Tax=Methylophaga frappieri (strain ATCC BAA-2434 / DSM 25690 / JAM7) TaxID=754477 RepID=I1YF02_METFJ|nr:hypothetical protein [Methylophaga frappieri]AFJ01495.1 hypothetical protein Q7C_317 [Methylophaga frappieri]